MKEYILELLSQGYDYGVRNLHSLVIIISSGLLYEYFKPKKK